MDPGVIAALTIAVLICIFYLYQIYKTISERD